MAIACRFVLPYPPPFPKFRERYRTLAYALHGGEYSPGRSFARPPSLPLRGKEGLSFLNFLFLS